MNTPTTMKHSIVRSVSIPADWRDLDGAIQHQLHEVLKAVSLGPKASLTIEVEIDVPESALTPGRPGEPRVVVGAIRLSPS